MGSASKCLGAETLLRQLRRVNEAPTSRQTARVIACPDEVMLRRVVELRNRFLPTATHMDEAEIAARYRRNAKAFTCILWDDVLAGYFILLPLNDGGAAAIRGGKISSGREIVSAYVARSEDEARAVYLSVVCAVTARARATVIIAITRELQRWYHEAGVRHLFVRAGSVMGARMLRRLTGKAVEADGVIHEIDLSAYEVITSRSFA
jgi:hypothetical protein